MQPPPIGAGEAGDWATRSPRVPHPYFVRPATRPDGPPRDREGRRSDAGLRPPLAGRTGPRDLGPPPRVRRGARGTGRLDPPVPAACDPRAPRPDVRPDEGGTGDPRRRLQARGLEEPCRRMGRGEAGPPVHSGTAEATARP